MQRYPIALADALRHSPPPGLDPAIDAILRKYGTPFADRVGSIIRDEQFKRPYFSSIEKAQEDNGESLNRLEWNVLEQIENLPEGRKATLFILSSLAFDRAAAAARIIRKNPGKVGKVIFGSGVPEVNRHMKTGNGEWDDTHSSRGRVLVFESDSGEEIDISDVPGEVFKQAKEELDSTIGYDRWNAQYIAGGKTYTVRKISEAEAIARYLVKYAGRKIREEGIQILGEEGSVDTRTNFTKLVEYSMLGIRDTDIFFISDRRHEPAVMGKYRELFSTPGVQPNRTRDNPDGTIDVTTEIQEALHSSFRGFLSVEGIFSKYPTKFGGKTGGILRDIHEFSPDGIWAYGNNVDARKKLGGRTINSTYSNLVPSIQHAVNTVWKTRPITYGGAFQYIFQDGKWSKIPYNHS